MVVLQLGCHLPSRFVPAVQFELRGKSAVLRLRTTVNTSSSFLGVFNDFRPNKQGEPVRTQHPADDPRGEPGSLVFRREDGPGGAAGQSECLCLCIERNKSGSYQGFANLPDLGRLSRLHICKRDRARARAPILHDDLLVP
jgi:hypothetical protein